MFQWFKDKKDKKNEKENSKKEIQKMLEKTKESHRNKISKIALELCQQENKHPWLRKNYDERNRYFTLHKMFSNVKPIKEMRKYWQNKNTHSELEIDEMIKKVNFKIINDIAQLKHEIYNSRKISYDSTSSEIIANFTKQPLDNKEKQYIMFNWITLKCGGIDNINNVEKCDNFLKITLHSRRKHNILSGMYQHIFSPSIPTEKYTFQNIEEVDTKIFDNNAYYPLDCLVYGAKSKSLTDYTDLVEDKNHLYIPMKFPLDSANLEVFNFQNLINENKITQEDKTIQNIITNCENNKNEHPMGNVFHNYPETDDISSNYTTNLHKLKEEFMNYYSIINEKGKKINDFENDCKEYLVKARKNAEDPKAINNFEELNKDLEKQYADYEKKCKVFSEIDRKNAEAPEVLNSEIIEPKMEKELDKYHSKPNLNPIPIAIKSEEKVISSTSTHINQQPSASGYSEQKKFNWDQTGAKPKTKLSQKEKELLQEKAELAQKKAELAQKTEKIKNREKEIEEQKLAQKTEKEERELAQKTEKEKTEKEERELAQKTEKKKEKMQKQKCSPAL